MERFKYIFRDAARLIVRHWGLSFLTILTSMAVFYLIGASVLLVLNTRHIVRVFEGGLTIQAYISPKANLEDVRLTVGSLPNVTKVKIVTSDMALARLKERIGSKAAEALTLLDGNPLPDSLEISVDRASNVAAVVRSLVTVPEISDTVYAGGLAEKIAKFSRFAGQFSVVMLIVAITASAVVLFNTIRIAVYSKEEEIGIMLMVGATPTFVAMPFVLEGIILGGLGALGASVFLVLSYNGIIDRLKELLPFLPFIENKVVLMELGTILVGAGATVSLIASLIAVEAFTRRAMKPL